MWMLASALGHGTVELVAVVLEGLSGVAKVVLDGTVPLLATVGAADEAAEVTSTVGRAGASEEASVAAVGDAVSEAEASVALAGGSEADSGASNDPVNHGLTKVIEHILSCLSHNAAADAPETKKTYSRAIEIATER